jgi:hypothetical protein
LRTWKIQTGAIDRSTGSVGRRAIACAASAAPAAQSEHLLALPSTDCLSGGQCRFGNGPLEPWHYAAAGLSEIT